nr:MAG TPA: hypothetical protein [Caudoviricetes sp.]
MRSKRLRQKQKKQRKVNKMGGLSSHLIYLN